MRKLPRQPWPEPRTAAPADTVLAKDTTYFVVVSGSASFELGTVAYTAEVANNVAETAVTPTTNHDGAAYVVQLDGADDADGTVELSVGTNGVSIAFNSSGATVRGLPTDNEWCYFVVRAVNARGTSDWSDHNAIQVQ